jgi:hypothetical protein
MVITILFLNNLTSKHIAIDQKKKFEIINYWNAPLLAAHGLKLTWMSKIRNNTRESFQYNLSYHTK